MEKQEIYRWLVDLCQDYLIDVLLGRSYSNYERMMVKDCISLYWYPNPGPFDSMFKCSDPKYHPAMKTQAQYLLRNFGSLEEFLNYVKKNYEREDLAYYAWELFRS